MCTVSRVDSIRAVHRFVSKKQLKCERADKSFAVRRQVQGLVLRMDGGGRLLVEGGARPLAKRG